MRTKLPLVANRIDRLSNIIDGGAAPLRRHLTARGRRGPSLNTARPVYRPGSAATLIVLK